MSSRVPMLNTTTSPTPLSQPPTPMPANIASSPSVLPLYPSVDIDAHVRRHVNLICGNTESNSVIGYMNSHDHVKMCWLPLQTESNHDTALTLACAGGHEELVSVLIARGANIEHRDKKGRKA